MDLSSIPVIDSHAHPFDPVKEEDDFRVYFNMSLWRPPTEVVKDTLVNRKLMRELGKELGVPIQVYGPETHMTKIASLALKE